MWWKNNHLDNDICVVGVVQDNVIQYCSITNQGYVLSGVGETLARNIRYRDNVMDIVSAGDRDYLENGDDVRPVHSFSGTPEDFKKEIKEANYIYLYKDNTWLFSQYDINSKAFGSYEDLRWSIVEMLREKITN